MGGQTVTERVEPIRVMVVDDSAVIRGLFTRVLESSNDIRVVASVGDGALALKALIYAPTGGIVAAIGA